MSWKPYFGVLLVIAPVAACAGPKIGYDYDSRANFGAYHTYEWIEGKQEASGDMRVDKDIPYNKLPTGR